MDIMPHVVQFDPSVKKKYISLTWGNSNEKAASAAFDRHVSEIPSKTSGAITAAAPTVHDLDQVLWATLADQMPVPWHYSLDGVDEDSVRQWMRQLSPADAQAVVQMRLAKKYLQQPVDGVLITDYAKWFAAMASKNGPFKVPVDNVDKHPMFWNDDYMKMFIAEKNMGPAGMRQLLSHLSQMAQTSEAKAAEDAADDDDSDDDMPTM